MAHKLQLKFPRSWDPRYHTCSYAQSEPRNIGTIELPSANYYFTLKKMIFASY